MKKILSIMLVFSMLFGGVAFGDVASAKKPVKPSQPTFGNVLMSPIVGQCSDTYTTTYVYVNNGYPNTTYTIEAAGATATLTTNENGSGSSSIAVPTPYDYPEFVIVNVSTGLEYKSYKVLMDCTGAFVSLSV